MTETATTYTTHRQEGFNALCGACVCGHDPAGKPGDTAVPADPEAPAVDCPACLALENPPARPPDYCPGCGLRLTFQLGVENEPYCSCTVGDRLLGTDPRDYPTLDQFQRRRSVPSERQMESVRAAKERDRITRAVRQALTEYAADPTALGAEDWVTQEVDGYIYSIHINPAFAVYAYADIRKASGDLYTDTTTVLGKALVLDELPLYLDPDELQIRPFKVDRKVRRLQGSQPC